MTKITQNKEMEMNKNYRVRCSKDGTFYAEKRTFMFFWTSVAGTSCYMGGSYPKTYRTKEDAEAAISAHCHYLERKRLQEIANKKLQDNNPTVEYSCEDFQYDNQS